MIWFHYHIAGFFAGFILDLLLGDPAWLPHPIRGIGRLIGWLEGWLYPEGAERKPRQEQRRGLLLVSLVLAVTGLAAAAVLGAGYLLHPMAGCLLESIMTWQILAVKGLKQESRKVYDRLKEGDLEKARAAVSMIVGRDTDQLDQAGIIRAAVETVAENTSDGAIAPMLYLAVGGPVLGLLYKAVNTMDSMLGYKNDRYLHFGRAAALLDDMVNYIPARCSAWLMIAACAFSGKEYDAVRAAAVFKRDRYKHASPNSAQTESVCAGALGIRLAGNASYFGKVVEKPSIGDAEREAKAQDILRAQHLLYASAWLCQLLCLLTGIIIGILLLPAGSGW